MKNIVVVAKVKVKEEYKDEVYTELLKLHKSTKKNSEGVLQYDLHKSLEEDNTFVFIEKWENSEFLDEHMAKQHFKDAVVNLDGKVESIEINKLEKLI
jgi:quinol monooxygenase YgiN